MNNNIHNFLNLLTELQKTVLSKAVEPGNHDQIRLLTMPGTGKKIIEIGNEIVATGEAAAQEAHTLQLWGFIRRTRHGWYSITRLGRQVGERIRAGLYAGASPDKDLSE